MRRRPKIEMSETDRIISLWKDHDMYDIASGQKFKITDDPILNGDVTLNEVIEKIKNGAFYEWYPEYGYEDGPEKYVFDFSDVYRRKGFRYVRFNVTPPFKVSI